MKKHILSLYLVVICLVSTAQTDKFFSTSNSFFTQYVADGLVNYTGILADTKSLNQLLSSIETVNLASLSEQEKKAFLINTYNILVIAQIVKNHPVSSPIAISGFFDQAQHNVAGKQITLDYLEKTLLNPSIDPRLHFVLVCGAKGCPPIINSSYKPENLDEMLNQQAKIAANDTSFIQVNSKKEEVSLSELFKWYANDFGKTDESLLAFINTYRDTPIPANYKVKNYGYDWTLNEFKGANILTTPEQKTNLQTYTAGTLLKNGQTDLTLFNSIYTETKSNWVGINYDDFRITFASSLMQFTYGVSKNARFNVGVDINLKASAKNSSSKAGNIFSPLQLQNNDSMRSGIAYIAPRIKVSPIKAVPDFAVQSTLISSFVESPEGYSGSDTTKRQLSWLEWDRYIWWNQLFYSKSLANNKLQVFTELDLLFRFGKRKEQTSHLDLPVSLFLSWFPNKRATIYVMTQHVPRFVYNTNLPVKTDWVIGANYTQSGVGLKYMITKSLNVELLYTNFWRAVNAGQGQTFNLGIKYVH